MLSHGQAGSYNYYEENNLTVPQGCRTPDSIMSTESYSMTASTRQYHWRLPEKLQIVKPMEGSQTLKHWNRLATPTLSGLLEDRPGVTIRGSKGLDDLGLMAYSLSDCEEDFDDHPGKRFQPSGCIFTYTNSTVMHPDDGTSSISTMSRTNSQVASRMTSQCVSNQSSACITPRSVSRRNSCSTYSVNMGLASMLNERGIKAVTPSVLNTPCGINYSPTSTPCNSPEGDSSPVRHMSPEPKSFGGILTSGAELLRKKIIGDHIENQHKKSRLGGNTITLSRLERRALKSIKILEKVEHMGLDRIVSTNIPPSMISTLPTLNNALYSTRTASPMAQLTSLKKVNSSDSDDSIVNNKDKLSAVLNKDWSPELQSNDPINELNLYNPSSSAPLVTSNIEDSENSHSEVYPMNKRLKQMQRQKSRRNIKNCTNLQRQDLGTVGSTSKTVYQNNTQNKTDTQPIGFIGTISSLLFGRKGGLL